jgi:hypothetical protein
MFYISYQGIFDGKDYQDANTPPQISKAIQAGFTCMIDVWRIDGILYVGTEAALIEVTQKYIQGPRFYINCMNDEIKEWIVTQPSKLFPNYFWFEASTPPPPYATASNGKLITPGNTPINDNSIIFLPEIADRGLFSTVHLRCYGICSTYLTFIRRMRNEGIWY